MYAYYYPQPNSYATTIDDIDITHAISISNLLKVTVYDKSIPSQEQQLQKQHPTTASADIASLIDIRDKLNQLIQSLSSEKKEEKEPKEEHGKKIHRLTPAELGNNKDTCV